MKYLILSYSIIKRKYSLINYDADTLYCLVKCLLKYFKIERPNFYIIFKRKYIPLLVQEDIFEKIKEIKEYYTVYYKLMQILSILSEEFKNETLEFININLISERVLSLTYNEILIRKYSPHHDIKLDTVNEITLHIDMQNNIIRKVFKGKKFNKSLEFLKRFSNFNEFIEYVRRWYELSRLFELKTKREFIVDLFKSVMRKWVIEDEKLNEEEQNDVLNVLNEIIKMSW